MTRTRTRTRRLCYRHPSEPVTGICAACLRERLGDLEPSIIPTTLEDPDAGSLTRPDPGPGLRRCRSVSASRCEGSCSYPSEPRRRSCDDRSRSKTLVALFGVDDGEVGCTRPGPGSRPGSIVESKCLELSNLCDQSIVVEHENDEKIRVCSDALLRIKDVEEDIDSVELKTMKEFIDLEIRTKNDRKSRDLRGNFREAASVFSKKLGKWRQKQKEKKVDSRFKGRNGNNNDGSEIGECVNNGRRSCDIEPRYSVDAGRLSLEGSRISIDEPRASWDGYMVARTIPRLTPMLSVVENVLLGGTRSNGFEKHRASLDGQMQAIVEDESSSGGSGQSNSDSSSSQRGSSFDRSSSVRSFGKRTLGLELDEAKSMSNSIVSPAHVKLVFTERELKDWHLNSNIKDDNLNTFESFSKNGIVAENCGTKKGFKKSTRWREVFNLFGNKHKLNNKKGETQKGGETFSSAVDTNEKQGDKGYDNVKEAAQWRLTRSSSIVGARKSCSSSYIPTRNSCSNTFDQPRSSLDMTELNHSKKKITESAASNFGRDAFVLERNKSAKCSSNDIDTGDIFCGILEGGIHVVVKRIDLSSVGLEKYVLELDFFSKVSHPRLVSLLGRCLENENEKFLVYKYMPNGDLCSALFRKTNSDDASLQSLDWMTRLKIAIGTAEGLSYLHHGCNPPLVHRKMRVIQMKIVVASLFHDRLKLMMKTV